MARSSHLGQRPQREWISVIINIDQEQIIRRSVFLISNQLNTTIQIADCAQETRGTYKAVRQTLSMETHVLINIIKHKLCRD